MRGAKRIEIVTAAILLLLLFAWYFDDPTRTTPGFFVDESSIAYNALSIGRTGADEYGVVLPLYFRAFGEYKNPVYIYLLALVFLITGPSILAARAFSIVLGFLAAMALALLVRRLTGRTAAAVFALLAAVLTPWLFETSRLVFEVAAFPLTIALALLTVAEFVERAPGLSRRRGEASSRITSPPGRRDFYSARATRWRAITSLRAA